jgi:hypothetical protein
MYISIKDKNAHIDEYFKKYILSIQNGVVENINNNIIHRMFPRVPQTF